MPATRRSIAAAPSSDTRVRTLYRLASALRTGYRFVRRPRTFGVKCIVEHDGRWLMIRNSYGPGHWTLPGGGIRRHENPADAARREVAEEVGISVPKVDPIGSYFSTRHYSRDTVYCFRAVIGSPAFEIDGREVLEATWISPDAIPAQRGNSVDEVLRMLST